MKGVKLKKLALLLATGSLAAFGFAVDSGVASAKKKGGGKCHCKRGPRGFRGPAGRAGPAGPTGPRGPAGPAGGGSGSGGSNLQNYDALVSPNGTHSLTIGSFTFRDTMSGSTCGNITVTNNSSFPAQYSENEGGFTAHTLSPASTHSLAGTPGTEDQISVALNNGTSYATAFVGNYTLPNAAGCIDVGFITGS